MLSPVHGHVHYNINAHTQRHPPMAGNGLMMATTVEQRCDSHVSRWYINGLYQWRVRACVCACASIHDRPADRRKKTYVHRKMIGVVLAFRYACGPQSVSYHMSNLSSLAFAQLPIAQWTMIDDAVAHTHTIFVCSVFFDIDVFPRRWRRRRDKEIKIYTKNWHRGDSHGDNHIHLLCICK